MNTSLSRVFFVLALGLSGCSTCNPEAPPAANDGGVVAQDAQPGDGDGGAPPLDADADADGLDMEDLADTAETDADDADDVVDGDSLDAAEADAAEVVVGPPVPPTTECGEGVMSTPQPGDPCDIVGVTRCSDVGAKWVSTGLTTTVESKYCLQPHLLQCSLTVSGAKRWQLAQCPKPATSCAAKPKLAVPTCQDSAGQAVCAVKRTDDMDDPFTNALYPCSAQSELAEKTMCGTNVIFKCSTIQNAMPAPETPWVQALLDKYAPLKTCCPTCRYWLPYKTCGDMNIGVCWGWQNPEQGVKKAPVCLENIPGKPPSCVYTCDELKYSEEYGKPPWRK